MAHTCEKRKMKYFIGEENFPIYVHLVISSHRIVDIHYLYLKGFT